MSNEATAASSPGITGVSLLKVPATDLQRTLAWYEKVLNAERLPSFDHFDANGNLFAYMLTVPGLSCPLQLRLAPNTARNIAGFDPIGFAVPTRADLDAWEAYLNGIGVQNSGVLRGLVGWFLIVRDPDGLSIRIFSDEHHEVDAANAVVDSPWLAYPAEEN